MRAVDAFLLDAKLSNNTSPISRANFLEVKESHELKILLSVVD
jgi:hypothetical protein